MGVTSALAEKGPGMSYELAIEASGLAKSYRDVRVLAGVDLRVPEGSVFALLGPNGAGQPGTGL
jgi:ABC-2 type transport system ATP-binding protein